MSHKDRLERYRHRYATLKLHWMHATARYQALIAESIHPRSRVLDMGCGRGGIVERLGGKGRWIGLDPDWHSLADHRARFLPRCCGNAAALPFSSHSIDIVISSWVLEHLADPATVFHEIARVLRPGGHLFFLTPNASHPIPQFSQKLTMKLKAQHKLVHRLYNRVPADTFSVHYQANTWRKIDTYAAQAGLQLIEMEFIEDPSYLSWSALTFLLAVAFENVLPAQWHVHIVGHYRLGSE